MKTKFIKVISLAAVVVMMVSSTAMARASKSKIVKNVRGSNINLSDYLIYQDFTDIDPGSIPEGWAALNSNGEISSEPCNNGKKEKNCLTLTDTTGAANGPRVTIPISGCDKGYVLMETKFKFEKTGTGTYTVMTVQANGPEGKAAEGFFGSGSPSFTVRGSDNAGSGITPGQYSADTWYILRYVFNLDAKTIDASMTNEKTGETKAAYEMPLGTSVITTFLIYSEHYDGKWYYDYFNVKKINSDLKDYLDSIGGIKKQTIKKGVEATIVDGPANRALKNKLNIKLDGKYMYPFDEIISKNDVRYISARSLAYMISGSYTPSDEKCVIRYKDKMLELKANTDKALIDSESKSLSAKSIENDGKIYLPLEDSFTLFGYGYEFSNEANEAVVTTIDSAE